MTSFVLFSRTRLGPKAGEYLTRPGPKAGEYLTRPGPKVWMPKFVTSLNSNGRSLTSLTLGCCLRRGREVARVSILASIVVAAEWPDLACFVIVYRGGRGVARSTILTSIVVAA
jgi:hypothetical protein